MAKIKLPEEMTKDEIFTEYMKMRELLDQYLKENQNWKRSFLS